VRRWGEKHNNLILQLKEQSESCQAQSITYRQVITVHFCRSQPSNSLFHPRGKRGGGRKKGVSKSITGASRTTLRGSVFKAEQQQKPSIALEAGSCRLPLPFPSFFFFVHLHCELPRDHAVLAGLDFGRN